MAPFLVKYRIIKHDEAVMTLGFSFLSSKVARRFCTLFILCAFFPILIITVISYYRVVGQLEKQSHSRIQRETKAYGLGLFDRLIRVENELLHLGKTLPNGKENANEAGSAQESFSEILLNVCELSPDRKVSILFGTLDVTPLDNMVSDTNLSTAKSFLLTITNKDAIGRVFMGVNLTFNNTTTTIIGEIKPGYLWGIGSAPLLPPMTELFVFNASGESIVGTSEEALVHYRNLEKTYDKKNPRIFTFDLAGEDYFGSTSNLFIESRFQPIGWTIILAQTHKASMAALEQFSKTFPFVMILFLLLIIYLSVKFIRQALEPLESLKQATKRVAQQDFSTKVVIPGDDEFAELGSAFNTMSRTIEKQFHTMETVGEIDRAILSSTKTTSILYTALERLKSFFNCDIAMFARNAEHADDLLKVHILEGRREDDLYTQYIDVTAEEIKNLFTDTKHQVFNRNQEYSTFFTANVQKEINQYLELPVAVGDGIERALLLGWKESHELTDNELEQARQIADQLAVALNNSNLVENLENLASGTIEALARTVDAKSLWTAGHSERVAELAAKIAEAMHLTEQEVNLVKRGGLMHDIGKIGISVSILDKPGKLNDEEYKEIKNHPAIGAKILEPIEVFNNIVPIVEQHHEKYDGTGYPNGLKGEEIDINARILAVADVWDALVSNRPYRDGWVHERARSLISKGSGIHFDPQVVKTFLAIMDT